MTVDLNTFPATLDLLHIILLAALAIALLTLILKAFRKTSGQPGNLPAAEPEQTQAAPAPAPIATPVPATAPTAAAQFNEASSDAALQLLALLQQNARFIDFLQEDLRGFSDADIGAAARVVHEGGKKTLKDYFTLQPVRAENEESRVTLKAGFSAAEVRLTGNVTGEPPFTGTLIHRGWKAVEVKLPKLAKGHDTTILAAAEVEL
jgi:hypothetical protein